MRRKLMSELTNNNQEYGADQIQILEGLEAVRKRPGMYIGSTSARGLHHLVYEIVDNAVDEALAGYCKNIEVTIEKDNSITVEDDGRGIPVGMNHKAGVSALEVVFTVLHAGGKFGGGGYKVSGGLHGVGASVVNALSAWLTVEVYHDGKVYMQSYKRGKADGPVAAVRDCDPQLHGTKVHFLPDAEIFEENIGRSEADNGKQVLNELLQSKGLTIKPETPIVAVENDVKKQKVTFHNRFLIDIVGDLYFPADYDATKKYAAIIVGHPFGGVKEQTSGLHARKLAELGYVALAFDASYYGESGGYPRRMESPEVRVEDFSAAVDFLTNHPAVYADKIGVIGICGGGCYSVSATQIDHRIKALATISMYDMGRARRQGVGDSQTYEQRMAILDEIGRQRTMEYGGAVRKDIRALPEKVDENTPKFAIDFLDYYDNPQRGQHPNSTGYYSYTSLAPMMNFFPFAQIETISPRPMLFIVGENAVSKYFSEDAYAKAAEPKELFVVPGATHVDLYDQPKYLKITLPKLDSFFKQHLK